MRVRVRVSVSVRVVGIALTGVLSSRRRGDSLHAEFVLQLTCSLLVHLLFSLSFDSSDLLHDLPAHWKVIPLIAEFMK